MTANPIVMNKTINRKLTNISFDILPNETLENILRDGRVISHYMEHLLALEYGLRRVEGCDDHDLVDPSNPAIKYEVKTFTKRGCKIMPSNMIGTGRKFNKEVFQEKAKGLIYVIVSNTNFPDLKIRFMNGSDLAAMYPNGTITLTKHDAFFNDAI